MKKYTSSKHSKPGNWTNLGQNIGRSGTRFQPSTFGTLKDGTGGWADELPPADAAKSVSSGKGRKSKGKR